MDWGYKARLTATTVALLLMVVQLFGRRLAGVLGSPPLVAAIVAMQQHATGGPDAAAVFLRGHAGGLIGRIAFGTAFALLPWVLLLSVAAVLAFGAACLLTALGVHGLRDRGGAGLDARVGQTGHG